MLITNLRNLRGRQVISKIHQQVRRKMSKPLTATNYENVPQPNAKMQKIEVEPVLRVKKLSEYATLPVRGSSGAAGYDLARYVMFEIPV